MTRLVTFGETALRVTPPGREQLANATEVRLRADGTESNVAVAADRLGTPSVWVSKVPDTALGERVVSTLHEQGLETDVVWAEDHEGRQGLTFRERGADPRPARTVEDRHDAAVTSAEPGELPMTLVQSADAVVVGGSTPALGPGARETTEAVFRAASGTRVLVLDFRAGLWSAEEAREGLGEFLDAVDVLIGNEAEFRTVFDKSGKPRELAHSVAADGDFEQVVVTRSERGAIAWHDNVMHEQEAVDTERVDEAGLHDAFVGGFVHRLVEDAPTDDALRYGIATAALARTVPGPLATVDPEAVQAIVQELADAGRTR